MDWSKVADYLAAQATALIEHAPASSQPGFADEAMRQRELRNTALLLGTLAEALRAGLESPSEHD